MPLLFGRDANKNIVPLLLDASGNVIVSQLPTAAVLADGAANPTTTIIGAADLWFNETTFDRVRNNVNTTFRASAVYTTSFDSGPLKSHNAKGIFMILVITAAPGVQTLTPTILYSNATGNLGNLLAGAAQAAAGTFAYIVYPGVGVAGAGVTQVAGFVLPRTYAIMVAHSGAGNWTYQLDACLIN